MSDDLLDGITVLDLSRVLAGPIATMILGDLGANIIKVEPPKGDDTRFWAPIIDGESAYYMSINRNKRSIVINLKDRRGKELLYDLIDRSDIIIVNFRPITAKKLGVDYDTIIKRKPDILYCSIIGFRQGTIYDNKRAGDIIIQAMSGLMDATGEEGGGPVRIQFALFDIYAGMIAVISILSALYLKLKSGKGMKIEIPLYDSAIFSMTYIPMIYLMTGRKPSKMGSAHPSIVPYQAFKCKDNKYLAIGVFNDDMWVRLCQALNMTNMASNPLFKTNVDRVKNRKQLIPILENKFIEKTREEWIRILDEYGVLAGHVYSIDEVFEDHYVKSTDVVCNIKHPTLGYIKQLSYPAIFNGKKLTPIRHPPLKGENTIEILKELGYSDDKIEELISNGVVYHD